MKRIIFNILLLPLLTLSPALAFAAPVYACGSSTSAQQVSNGIDETNTSASCDASGVTNAIALAVNILSLVVGAAAIIVIILSGFKYITSGGDANKVGNAKNTLIYALVGVVLAALAQLLVHFVLNQSNQAIYPPCPSNSSILKSDPACH